MNCTAGLTSLWPRLPDSMILLANTKWRTEPKPGSVSWVGAPNRALAHEPQGDPTEVYADGGQQGLDMGLGAAPVADASAPWSRTRRKRCLPFRPVRCILAKRPAFAGKAGQLRGRHRSHPRSGCALDSGSLVQRSRAPQPWQTTGGTQSGPPAPPSSPVSDSSVKRLALRTGGLSLLEVDLELVVPEVLGRRACRCGLRATDQSDARHNAEGWRPGWGRGEPVSTRWRLGNRSSFFNAASMTGMPSMSRVSAAVVATWVMRCGRSASQVSVQCTW